MTDPIILGMSGKMGVGKNYISESMIVPHLIREVEIANGTRLVPFFLSFGSFIKSELYARDATLTYESLFHQKTKVVRTRLQEYGTALGRESVNKDLWIRHVEIWMRIQTEGIRQLNQSLECASTMLPLFVVQDIRFENELAFVQSFKNSFVVRVDAPDRHVQRVRTEGSNATHVSETSLDAATFDYHLDNSQDRPSASIKLDVQRMLKDILHHILAPVKNV